MSGEHYFHMGELNSTLKEKPFQGLMNTKGRVGNICVRLGGLNWRNCLSWVLIHHCLGCIACEQGVP